MQVKWVNTIGYHKFFFFSKNIYDCLIEKKDVEKWLKFIL